MIVTIPEKRIPELPDDLFAPATADAVVVDTGNYYPPPARRAHRGDRAGTPESRWVEEQLGHRGQGVQQHLCRTPAQHGRPAGSEGRIALPVAGDDQVAKDVVLALVDELGFDPVDAGGLDDSWRQQPGTPVYGTDFDAEGVRQALAQASRSRRRSSHRDRPRHNVVVVVVDVAKAAGRRMLSS